jgi:hypothetical protein
METYALFCMLASTDAPTPKAFAWKDREDVQALCREKRVVEAVTKLPLSYPRSMDPKGFVLTTVSIRS